MPDLYDVMEAAPLAAAGWTEAPPISGVPRWRSPDGRRVWPLWRALEHLRNVAAGIEEETPNRT